MLPQGKFEFFGYMRWRFRPFKTISEGPMVASRGFSTEICNTTGILLGWKLERLGWKLPHPHWIVGTVEL